MKSGNPVEGGCFLSHCPWVFDISGGAWFLPTTVDSLGRSQAFRLTYQILTIKSILKYTLMIRKTASTYWFGGYDFNQFFGYHFSQVQLSTHSIQVCYIYLYILYEHQPFMWVTKSVMGNFSGQRRCNCRFFHAGIGANHLGEGPGHLHQHPRRMKCAVMAPALWSCLCHLSNEKKTWLVGLYKGFYYPVI